MKRVIGALAVASTFVSSVAFANCGPFGMFGDNDYCVTCPTSRPEKVNACPGGDVGMVAVGLAHPGCQVTYWSSSCGNASIMSENLEKADLNAKFNPVKPGRAAVTMDGDNVVVRMTKGDFDKLAKIKDKK